MIGGLERVGGERKAMLMGKSNKWDEVPIVEPGHT